MELLTLILFGVTAYHDGVNDAHGDIVAYLPNQPMYLAKPAPAHKDRDYTEQELVSALPNLHDSLMQLALAKSLGNLGDERFGKMIAVTNPFPPNHVELGRCFAKFRDELGEASSAIQRRNSGGGLWLHADGSRSCAQHLPVIFTPTAKRADLQNSDSLLPKKTVFFKLIPEIIIFGCVFINLTRSVVYFFSLALL